MPKQTQTASKGFRFVTIHVIVLIFCVNAADAQEFSYKNQHKWYTQWEQCGGNRQSPINLNYYKSKLVNLPPIVFHNYNTTFSPPLRMVNNGKTVEIKIPQENANVPYITGGLLKGKYITEGIHFHWGSVNTEGSEHFVDGQSYGMEMHIVHRNAKYKSIEIAREFKDGLAVIAVVFEVVHYSTYGFSEIFAITDSLGELRSLRSSATLPSFFNMYAMIPYFTSPYYTYEGSLTTPPCSEAVTWVVFTYPLLISASEIKKFRALQSNRAGSVIWSNYRHLQRVGWRPVYLVDHPSSNIFV